MIEPSPDDRNTDSDPPGAEPALPPLTPEEIAAADDFASTSSRLWWLYLIGGILSILFGALVLSFEFATIFAVAIFVGAYLVAWGIMQFVAAAQRGDAPKWLYIVAGIVAVIAGVLALVWPGITLFVLSIFIGWLLIIWAIVDIVGSFFMTHQRWWWLYLIRGILAGILGIWALAHPGLTLVVLVTVIGIAAFVFGIVEVIVSFQIRHLDRKWDRKKREWGIGDHADPPTAPSTQRTEPEQPEPRAGDADATERD